jgi:hypothetical protein
MYLIKSKYKIILLVHYIGIKLNRSTCNKWCKTQARICTFLKRKKERGTPSFLNYSWFDFFTLNLTTRLVRKKNYAKYHIFVVVACFSNKNPSRITWIWLYLHIFFRIRQGVRLRVTIVKQPISWTRRSKYYGWKIHISMFFDFLYVLITNVQT